MDYKNRRQLLLEVLCIRRYDISYSKDVYRPTGASRKIGEFTNSYKKLSEHFEEIFKETTNKYFPIRRINIGLNNLQDDSFTTITFFTDIEAEEKERKLQETIVGLRNKYGKNTVLKGISYLENATARDRNRMVGGHNGGE